MAFYTVDKMEVEQLTERLSTRQWVESKEYDPEQVFNKVSTVL